MEMILIDKLNNSKNVIYNLKYTGGHINSIQYITSNIGGIVELETMYNMQFNKKLSGTNANRYEILIK